MLRAVMCFIHTHTHTHTHTHVQHENSMQYTEADAKAMLRQCAVQYNELLDNMAAAGPLPRDLKGKLVKCPTDQAFIDQAFTATVPNWLKLGMCAHRECFCAREGRLVSGVFAQGEAGF
jgi:hypothetical protein